MPDTFTFEEAEQPESFSFEESKYNPEDVAKFATTVGPSIASTVQGIITNPAAGLASQAGQAQIQKEATEPKIQQHTPNIFERLSEAAPSVFGQPGVRPPGESPTGLLPNVAQVLYGRQTAPGEKPEPGLMRFSPKDIIPPQEGYFPELARQATGLASIENIGIIKGLGALESAPGKAVNLLKAASRAYFAKQGAEAIGEAAGKRTSGAEQSPQEKAQEDFQIAMGAIMSGVPAGEAVVKLKNSLENVSAGAGKLLEQSIRESLPRALEPEVRPPGETGGRIQPPIGMARLPEALEFTRGGIPIPRDLPRVPQEAPQGQPTYEPSGLGRPEVGELGQGQTPAFRPMESPNIMAPTPETGRAAQAVREMDAQRARTADFSKAVAEKVSQEQEEPIHPDKPLTANQLKIVKDSLVQAVADNQIPGPRKGLIVGSALDKWSTDVLKDGGAHLGPDVAAAYLVRGAAALERGITGFAEWSAHLIREIGEGVIPHLKELFEQSKQYRVEQLTGERKYASGKQETTAVHGNVQSQQGEGEGKVPADESGKGVQPQTQEGVQNAAQGQERILLKSEQPEFDALPKLQPGERVVRIVPADGSKPYLASFADKVWDWGGKRMANVGKNVDGKWSHGMLKPDDTIVELDQSPEATKTLTPAVIAEGQVFTGKTHGEAGANAIKAEKVPGRDQGFVTDSGKFLTRQEAIPIFRQLAGDKKLTNPAGLMSEDLKAAGLLKHLDQPSGLIAGSGIEKWADQQLKGGGTHLGPDVLAAYAVKGAAVIERGITEFAKWSKVMVEKYGDSIKPHLQDLFNQAKSIRAQAFSRKAEVKPAPAEVKPTPEPVAEAPESKSPTSLKNAIVDKERAARGLPPMVTEARRGFGQVWDEASKKIDEDKYAGQKLVDSLTKNPRAATDLEDAILLHRKIELQNDFEKANDAVVSARERGDDATRIENEVRVAQLSDDLQAMDNVSKRTGTENARGLNARKMLSNEDFTLAQMTLKKRAANRGKPLSDPQQKAINDAYEKIRKSQKRLDDYLTTRKPPTPRSSKIVLDEQGMKLKVENERLKSQFRMELLKDRLKQRSFPEKAQDTFVKWRRAFLLSNPTTLAKLVSAAVQRMAITPAEEVIGAGLSKVIPSIASKAPREGGFNVRAESKAITEGFTKGMRDAWDVLKTGRSALDVQFGPETGLPREAIDFIGNLHGALKTVTKRNEFARSFQKRVEQAMRSGIDATDPMVQTRLATEAYQDANRSIFQQDNRVVTAYKRGLQALEQRAAGTGKVPLGAKTVATVAKTFFPIIKIPTNIVAETLQYATGSVTGSVRLGRALARGVENLKPEEADLIMRNLKKGSLGAAVMMVGFLNPDVVGGYYQPGKKRSKGDVKAASIRIGDTDIPSYLLHNPLMETAQIGATIRRVADSKLHKKDLEAQGIGVGSLAAMLGLLEETPFLREPIEVAKAWNPNERTAFFGELSRSLAVPQLVQWAAQQRDKDIEGEPISRNPKTFGQHIEVGIPGLREDVPQRVSR